MVLRAHRAYQDSLAPILPERILRRIRSASGRDAAHALGDVRRSVRRDGPQAGDRGGSCARPSGDAAGVHSRQSALAVPELPQTQDSAGSQAGEVSGRMLAGLVLCETPTQKKPQVGAVVYAALQPGAFSLADHLAGVIH